MTYLKEKSLWNVRIGICENIEENLSIVNLIKFPDEDLFHVGLKIDVPYWCTDVHYHCPDLYYYCTDVHHPYIDVP